MVGNPIAVPWQRDVRRDSGRLCHSDGSRGVKEQAQGGG